MNAKAELSPEECARLGDELYEKKIRALVEKGNEGKIVAIDIDSGDFAVADKTLDATDQVFARRPNAQIWIIRIGQGWVHSFGGWRP